MATTIHTGKAGKIEALLGEVPRHGSAVCFVTPGTVYAGAEMVARMETYVSATVDAATKGGKNLVRASAARMVAAVALSVMREILGVGRAEKGAGWDGGAVRIAMRVRAVRIVRARRAKGKAAAPVKTVGTPRGK